MQKVPDMVQQTTILLPIRVRYRLPVELQQRLGFMLMNIPVIDPLNALELKSE